ncbi:MAG TPA: KTSC domain-containing protein [Caulobacteraceae bacterium]|nr:KTSC domain-containing protein [Caulobacteraceae bacterium]
MIRRFRYDEDSRTLFVTFTSGEDYAYFDVPPEVDAGFRQAFSKGTYFQTRIRDRFPYQRIRDVLGVTSELRDPRRPTGARPPSSPAAGR